MATASAAARMTIITTLADAYCYPTSERLATATASANPSGAVQPSRRRGRRAFPQALRRLRDRLRLLDERLALDVNALRQEVINLELQQMLLQKNLKDRDAYRRQHALSVVAEYFDVFRHGWEIPPGLERPRDIHTTYHGSLRAQRRRDFLRTRVDPLVAHELSTHWQSLSQTTHGELRIMLESIECGGDADEPIVIARGVLVGSIGYQTSSQTNMSMRKAESLVITQPIAYPCRIVCCFAGGRIVRHAFEMDRVSALQRAMGTLGHVDLALQSLGLCESPVGCHTGQHN